MARLKEGQYWVCSCGARHQSRKLAIGCEDCKYQGEKPSAWFEDGKDNSDHYFDEEGNSTLHIDDKHAELLDNPDFCAYLGEN